MKALRLHHVSRFTRADPHRNAHRCQPRAAKNSSPTPVHDDFICKRAGVFIHSRLDPAGRCEGAAPVGGGNGLRFRRRRSHDGGTFAPPRDGERGTAVWRGRGVNFRPPRPPVTIPASMAEARSECAPVLLRGRTRRLPRAVAGNVIGHQGSTATRNPSYKTAPQGGAFGNLR